MSINIRSITLIAVALVVAGIAAYLARSMVTTAPQAEQTVVIQEKIAETQVLVASKSLGTGDFLRQEDLQWQSWPDGNIHETYFSRQNGQDASTILNDLEGSVIKSPIAAGEPIINGRVVKPGSQGFMAAVLKPGHRAVSININSRTGISGFIFPGDLVDILLTHTVDEGQEGDNGGSTSQIRATETVLEAIRVLAIDTQMSNNTNTPSVGKIATFEVSPKQAEKIALMSRLGELSLSLRSLANENSENDAGKSVARNNTQSNVTYADEVSSVIADQSHSGGSTSNKSVVKIVRAGQSQDLIFSNKNK